MAGQKFEQANGGDSSSGKKYSEIHSYIAVYLGRDPMRQSLFVQTFQDLGISSLQVPEGTQSTAAATSAATAATMTTSSSQHSSRTNIGGQHRWIAGFRRLFRTQGGPSLPVGSGSGFGSASGSGSGQSGGGGGSKEGWSPSDDEGDESIDPQFDDIYSILPPHKKPRLDRTGRPTDATAAGHHVKRRKMDENGFSKLRDSNALDQNKWGSDAEMSE